MFVLQTKYLAWYGKKNYQSLDMNDRNIKKALITGITGSGGSYLADYIAEYLTSHVLKVLERTKSIKK